MQHSSSTTECWKSCSRVLESDRTMEAVEGSLVDIFFFFPPVSTLIGIFDLWATIILSSSSSLGFHHTTASHSPSWYTASPIAGLSLSRLWCVSFNYPDCTNSRRRSPCRAVVLKSQTRGLGARQIVFFFVCWHTAQWVNWHWAENDPFFSFRWRRAKRTAGLADVNWRSDWSVINPDVGLITIPSHFVCSWWFL